MGRFHWKRFGPGITHLVTRSPDRHVANKISWCWHFVSTASEGCTVDNGERKVELLKHIFYCIANVDTDNVVATIFFFVIIDFSFPVSVSTQSPESRRMMTNHSPTFITHGHQKELHSDQKTVSSAVSRRKFNLAGLPTVIHLTRFFRIQKKDSLHEILCGAINRYN